MKISKITKKQVKDILIRTVKTFIAAGVTAVAALPTKDNPKAIMIAFGSAGVTAVMNAFLKLFQESED